MFSMGPFQPSGKWTNKKSKEEIFSHLGEYGITQMVAKSLLNFDESKVLAKVDGLRLIHAMNVVINDTNVLTSTWDKVMMFYKSEFKVDFETPEPPDLRFTLIPKWIELALGSSRASGGFDDALNASEDPATTIDLTTGDGGEKSRPSSPAAPPLPAPPAKSAFDIGIEALTARIAAAEAKAAAVRSNLAANVAASKEETEKAERAESEFREHRLKKKADDERKHAIMAELELKLVAAERVTSELLVQDDCALATLDTARKKQASFASLKASTRDLPFVADSAKRSPSPAGDPKRFRLEDRLDSADALLAKALAGGRMLPPPPPPPPSTSSTARDLLNKGLDLYPPHIFYLVGCWV